VHSQNVVRYNASGLQSQTGNTGQKNMADLKMNRTWLCSVVFTDIVKYSSQSVELQMKWKTRFNGYLASAIRDVPEDERVILDTGDGAAICFLGAPEAAMFAALELWHSLLLDEREQQPQLRVRIGINLGSVKLVKDINGALNALGDGMNTGQRIMSFAAENQILVSQSFFEVVSRLSDDYKTLFTLKGVETDKHVREHTVYNLSPPGAEQSQASVTPQPATSVPPAGLPGPHGAVLESAPRISRTRLEIPPHPELPAPPAERSFGSVQVMAGSLAGQKFRITKAGLLVGTDRSKCQICVTEDAISREHAWIVPVDNRVVVIDRGSTNGTYLNSVDSPRLSKVVLQNGDRVYLGRKGSVVLTYFSS
jgi:class 3 adenylate cyclase